MKQLYIVGITLAWAALSGCTPTGNAEVRESARELGEQAQTAAEGVRQAASDVALEAKVKTALSTRKGLTASEIDVEAKDGHVRLKGDVVTQTQADLAVEVAEGTEGVKSVVNELMLRVPAKGSAATTPSIPTARGS